MRPPVLTAFFVLATLAAFLFARVDGSTDQQQLFWLGVLDVDLPGQAWRIGTAHMLHTDANHLLLNLGALALLGWLIERESRCRLAASVLIGAAIVATWFFLFGRTPYYCGWSGVLNTLLIVALYGLHIGEAPGAIAGVRRHTNNLLLLLLALGALAKNFFELSSGTALLSAGDWLIAPGAHLAGWAGGVVLAFCIVLGPDITRQIVTRVRLPS